MPWINDVQSMIAWYMRTAGITGPSETLQNIGNYPYSAANAVQQMLAQGGGSIDVDSWMRYYGQIGGGVNPGSVIPLVQGGDIRGLLDTPVSQQQDEKAQIAPLITSVLQPAAGLPSNVDPYVFQAIAQAAKDTGVPLPLALAIAYQESRLDPNAKGDYEGGDPTSFGLYQLHIGGELTSAGIEPYQAADPYLNAKIALSHVAEVMRAHPDWDWATIAVTAQGADNTNGNYTNSIAKYLDQIQTGAANTELGWANQVLQNPSVGGLGSLQNQLGGQSSVPQPFPSNYFQSPSLSFGEQWSGETEEGEDYPMPEGTQLITPVGGTIELQDDGDRNWGKRVLVVMPNGWKFSIGHMMDFAVSDGQVVNPGEVLGTSGGGPQSSSPGFSSGPHIEVQFIDPSGQFVDPHGYLQEVFQGTTYASWAGGAFITSTQIPAQPRQSLARTPDGRLIDYNTPEGTWYHTVDQAWQSIYGQHAPLQAAIDFRNSGIKTVDQLQNALYALPSSIPGVNIGTYKQFSSMIQGQAQKSFGRPVPESLMRQLYSQGIRTSSDIRLWFESHPSSSIPADDYQNIYDSAASWTRQIWNDVPHPDDVSHIWQQSGGYTPNLQGSGSGGDSYLQP